MRSFFLFIVIVINANRVQENQWSKQVVLHSGKTMKPEKEILVPNSVVTLSNTVLHTIRKRQDTYEASLLSKKWTRNKSLDGYEAHPRTTETAKSIVQCGTMCQSLSGCLSFFYNSNQPTTNCNLHNKMFTNNSGLTLSADTKYYKMYYTSFGDCDEAFTMGFVNSGVYSINLGGGQLDVRCDMSPDTGGWIVIQRRMNASDFYKTWNEYKNGFGDLNSNFWIGNDMIWALTQTGSWKLRIDLTWNHVQSGYAEYSSFAIGNEASNYVLFITGYTGTIGDSFTTIHNGMPFTTKDRDNDFYGRNCAQDFHGAWWYNKCHDTNLNGEYGNQAFGVGINWYLWKGYTESMTMTEMKIKRIA